MNTRALLLGTLLLGAAVGAATTISADRLRPPRPAASQNPPGAPPPAINSEGEASPEELADLQRAFPGITAAFLNELPLPQQFSLCGMPVPLDRADIREAVTYELILTVGKPLMPLLWTRRAPSVLPAIEAQLGRRRLPDDLKYLPMIESDLRWTARSPANAVGLWQFVDGTARRYGLRIDGFIDQRLDPELATDAGLRYLSDLHDQFGDWFLALAAYNSGEGTVSKAVEEQGRRSYFAMYLPYETRRYVPRLIAAKLVYEHPELYGLVRMAPLYVPRYRYIDINVQGKEADLVTIARQRGLDYAALRLSNPQIRGSKLPTGRHRLRMPDVGDGGPLGETGSTH